MTKNKIECSHCLLGIGYTSKIASYLLKQRGIGSIIIGLKTDKATFDLQLSNKKISPIPIFPVINSALFKALKISDLSPLPKVEISYSEINNCRISNYDIQPNSFAEFIINQPTEKKAFGLSLKQWGDLILSNPFSEVQNKIKRHYLSGNNNSRIGYYNGLSLYYQFVKSVNYDIHYLNSIDLIDYQKKIIIADNFEIHYEKLVSTIPINHLLAYCKIDDSLQLAFEGSYFLYFTHTAIFHANKMIYDCDLQSSIIRVFSSTDFSLIVQVPSYKKGVIVISDILRRLLVLLPMLRDIKFEKELFLPMSYPIEPITNATTLEKIKYLKDNSIIPFGRFGNWEYSDLHELNWENII